MNVSARHEKIACAGFDEARGGAEILNLARIRRGRNQNGISAGFGRAMDVGEKRDAISHRHRHVVDFDHGVRRLRQVS